jgi:hypothetical protein
MVPPSSTHSTAWLSSSWGLTKAYLPATNHPQHRCCAVGRQLPAVLVSQQPSGSSSSSGGGLTTPCIRSAGRR